MAIDNVHPIVHMISGPLFGGSIKFDTVPCGAVVAATIECIVVDILSLYGPLFLWTK